MQRNELEAMMSELDTKYPSPNERATTVWNILHKHDLTDWDILCFCVEYIALMSQRWSWLENVAKIANGLVYRAHYLIHDKYDLAVGNAREQQEGLAAPSTRDGENPRSNIIAELSSKLRQSERELNAETTDNADSKTGDSDLGEVERQDDERPCD